MKSFFIESDIDEIVNRISEDAKQFENKTILITGARGFLGRYFIEAFKKLNKKGLKNPVAVIGLDNFITSGEAGMHLEETDNIKFVKHDVTKPYITEKKIDYVIHAAGIASPHYYRIYPLETLDVAIMGTKHMLELAKSNNAKFLFFSSSEVYGDPDSENIPTMEEYRGNVSSIGDRACYDESKRVGETLCDIYYNHFNVKTNIVRPFNFYGPGMQEKDYRVLPNFASKIKSGKPLEVYGKGNQTRTFCYITDAITGLFKIILKGKPGEIYNIGNPVPEISVLELVKSIQDVFDKNVNYNVIEYPESYPSNEPSRRCPNIDKARKEVGYEPQVSLKDGLRRFLHWSEQNYRGE